MRYLRILLLLTATAGCVSSGTPADPPKQVFVHPAARELRISERSPGQVDVTYGVQEIFPAPQLRESIARRLRESGYHLLDHDLLDPSAKVETPREWASYIDGTTRSETCVREIVEDWQNANGDVVRYGLRYDSSCGQGPVRRSEPTTDSLKVTVAAIPASVIREILDAPLRDVQRSHIEANVPPAGDFARFLRRDLVAHFAKSRGKTVPVEYEMLRDGPTQSGVAYPKFYVWVRVLEGASVVEQGAARLAAVERREFQVLGFLTEPAIRADAAAMDRVFPVPVADRIRARLGLPQTER